MLAKPVDVSARNWDRCLPYVLYACRTCIQESTWESPFHLLYGQDARLPIEAALSKPCTCYQVDVDNYKTDLVTRLSEAWELAQQNMQRAQWCQEQYYDGKSKSISYRVGDRMFVYMPAAIQGTDWKFAKPFHGPSRILDVTETNASVRPVDRPQDAPIFISLNRVRRCPPPPPPPPPPEVSDKETWLGTRSRSQQRQEPKPMTTKK